MYKSIYSGLVIDSCITLADVTENGKTGLRLLKSNPENHGDIGHNAIDLSTQLLNSSRGALGDYSVALGKNTTANAEGSLVLGSYNIAKQDTVFEIGVGDSENSLNALEIHKDGKAAAPELTIALINTPRSLVTKEYVDASGGELEKVTENGKTGWRIKTGVGTNIGNRAIDLTTGFSGYASAGATAYYAHSEGYATLASGYGAHAEGVGYYSSVTASGSASHAEGFQTMASGRSSHAEGYSTGPVEMRISPIKLEFFRLNRVLFRLEPLGTESIIITEHGYGTEVFNGNLVQGWLDIPLELGTYDISIISSFSPTEQPLLPWVQAPGPGQWTYTAMVDITSLVHKYNVYEYSVSSPH